MGFLRDLDRSQEAVQLAMSRLIDRDFICHELEGKEEQKFGDIRVITEDVDINIEVKFDAMAEKTGNLCFEMSNGKRLTGILETKADEVWYVVPNGGQRTIYKFDINTLKTYILNPENITVKNGGDKWKFSLALVSIDKIINDKIAYEVIENAELSV